MRTLTYPTGVASLLDKLLLPLILAVVFFFEVAGVHATTARFQSIDVNDGLAGNMVRNITQDKLGYMWFGTNTGLVKYDGYTLTTYQNDNYRSNSVGGSFIRALEVDEQNVLWVGGGKGLSRYNRSTDDFTVYSENAADHDSLISDSVNSIQRGKAGYLWLATDAGLELFDSHKEVFMHYRHDSQDTASLPSNNVRTLMMATNGDLWIGTVKGLAVYQSSTGSIERIRLTEGEQSRVISISESRAGKVWISSDSGLFQYDPTNQSVKNIQLEDDAYWITSTFVDDDDNLWFSQLNRGVSRLDTNGEILNFVTDKGNTSSLAGQIIMSMFTDHSGIMWLGTFRSGLSYFNPDSLDFGSFNDSTSSMSCLNATLFNSVLPLEADRMLLGTYTAGLVEVDLRNKTCNNHLANADVKSSLSSNWVNAIHRDSQGNIWIATDKGLDKFDRERGKFDSVVSNNSNIEIHRLMEHKGYLILAGQGELHKFNLSTGELSVIPAKEEALMMTTYSALAKDNGGTIWGATQHGLVVVDSQLNEVRQVISGNNGMLQQAITALTVDKNNLLWLGIDEYGLFHYDPTTQALAQINDTLDITVKHGLAGLYLGHGDDVWLATLGKGLFKIEQATHRVTHYQVNDGLNSQEVSAGAFARFPDGRLFFGGSAGFNIFNPQKIQTNKTAPIVSLTHLRRFGEKVIPGQDYDGLRLNKDISELESLTLSHRDSVIGFEFTAMHFADPNAISYLYRLKGLDETWTRANAKNRGVTYNNLDPGNYTFQLKAKTADGVWSEKDVALKLTVLPAPWATWWAYILYLSLFKLGVWGYINRRTHLLEKRTEVLKTLVDQRTRDLVTEKNKVEQLLSCKQEEFANISHELRTPLALILGPAQQIKSLPVSTQIRSKVDIITRNANRMLRLVDQLLQLETFRAKIVAQKSVQDFQTITRLITESFDELAKSKEIELTIEQNDPVYFEFTPDALEKILLNLLSNALKYTPPGNRIAISSARDDQRQLVISVKDTGMGIPEEQIAAIFDRFNRVLDVNSERITGAGIGLALVKELVEAHEGRIVVESSVGEGTNFTVYLPIIGEVDSPDEAYLGNNEMIEFELSELSSELPLQTPGEVTDVTDRLVATADRPSVLVIEDNPDMQGYITECLAPNFNFIMASNGKDGLAMAKAQVPDIIISDVMMPQMDGYQFTQALRKELTISHIPVILLTALGDRQSRLQGWHDKADEYLTKPFDVEELTLRVENLLAIRQLTRARLNASLFPAPAEPLVCDADIKLEPQSPQFNKEKEFLRQLDSALVSLYEDPELKVDTIAASLCMSQRQLLRKLKAILAMTPVEYLRHYRLDKARTLLLQGLPASRVAVDVGFSTHSHFSKSFKSQFGCPPSEFNQQDQSLQPAPITLNET